MNWILKLVASATLKTGIAYAIKATRNVYIAIEAILNAGNLSDEARRTLAAIYATIGVVHDFLRAVGGLVGAPAEPTTSAHVETQLEDATAKLRRITEVIGG